MSLEADIALIPLLLDEVRALRRDVCELRAERQHQGGHWGTRAEAARHHRVSVDTIDAMIARAELRAERIGPEPELRRDRLGRRIDRRPVRVWIDAAPLSDGQVDAAAREARA